MNRNLKIFLSKNKVFTNKMANAFGISNALIIYYTQKKILHKYSRGIYISDYIDSPELNPIIEELLAILLRLPEGVVCLISALNFYNLTDQIPRNYWLAIPNKKWAAKIKHTRIFRYRHYEEGKTFLKIEGHEIPIYEKERTIIDCFKFLEIEIAVKALKLYLKGSTKFKPDLQKLEYYSKILNKDISDYIRTINT